MNRIINPHSHKAMAQILNRMDVSSQGVSNMVPKAFALPIRLTAVQTAAANIIKQEMLTVGGDAAIARGVVEGEKRETDVVLFGTVDKIKKLVRKLSHYTKWEIPEIRSSIERLLLSYMSSYEFTVECRSKKLLLDKPKLVGILNVTTDSFSDGGDFVDKKKALQHALRMADEGAEIIEVGGESTRPGAREVELDEEIKRVVPLISRLKENIGSKIIAVDTYKAEVARRAIAAGADIVNDISALRFDENMVKVLSPHENVAVVLMHIQGTPLNMQTDPHYKCPVDDIIDFFAERLLFCVKAGIKKERLIIDPGIGFGKTYEHNIEILSRLSEFHALGVPVMLGASRKSFINHIYPSEPNERLFGTLALTAHAYHHNIQLVRVHDVRENRELLQTLIAINPVQ